MWTGSVRRVQNKCWSETGERLEPRKISAKDMLWKLLYADDLAMVADVEADLQEQLIVTEWKDVEQTWSESKLGEYGGNVGGTEEERVGNTPG